MHITPQTMNNYIHSNKCIYMSYAVTFVHGYLFFLIDIASCSEFAYIYMYLLSTHTF